MPDQARPARRRQRRGHGGWTKYRNRPAWCADGRAGGRRGSPRPWPAPQAAAGAPLAAIGPRSEGRGGRARRAPARCRWRPSSPHDRWRAARSTATTCRTRRPRDPAVRRRPSSSRGPTTSSSRFRSAASSRRARSISPSATATPSALAARESPIDFSVSRVATVAPRALRFADALRGQQRTFDLDEMHVGGIVDAGVGQRRAHRGRDHVDLRHPAEMLGRQRRRVRPSDRQRRADWPRRLPRARTRSNAAPCRLRCRPTSRDRSWPPDPPKDDAGTSGSTRAPRSRARSR